MKVKTLRNWHFITLFNKVGEIVGEISWARFKEVFFAQAIPEIGVVNTCPRQGTLTLDYIASYSAGTQFTFTTSNGDKVLTLTESVAIKDLGVSLNSLGLDVLWITSTDGYTNSNYIYYKSNTLEITGVSVTTPNIGYGRLYNEYAAVDVRGLAPTGWHVPSNSEWDALVLFIGGESIGGGKLKEIGYSHWNTPNTGATNDYGFSARGTGKNASGTFVQLKTNSLFWCSDLVSSYNCRQLYYNNSTITPNFSSNELGMSVRCIKDDAIPSVSPITDIDGNVYTEVVIGTQIWMVENLKTKKYRNGDAIGTDFSGTTGAVCAYNNDEAYV